MSANSIIESMFITIFCKEMVIKIKDRMTGNENSKYSNN